MSYLDYHQHPKKLSCQEPLGDWQEFVEKKYQSRTGAHVVLHSVGLL